MAVKCPEARSRKVSRSPKRRPEKYLWTFVIRLWHQLEVKGFEELIETKINQ